jgi:hypothetical protein
VLVGEAGEDAVVEGEDGNAREGGFHE